MSRSSKKGVGGVRAEVGIGAGSRRGGAGRQRWASEEVIGGGRAGRQRWLPSLERMWSLIRL